MFTLLPQRSQRTLAHATICAALRLGHQPCVLSEDVGGVGVLGETLLLLALRIANRLVALLLDCRELLLPQRTPRPESPTNPNSQPGAASHKPNTAPHLPHGSPSGVDLLGQLLQFSPSKRPTAAQALRHPYLRAYHEAPEEDLPIPDVDMAFEAHNPSREALRQMVWQEVCYYHPELRSELRRELLADSDVLA